EMEGNKGAQGKKLLSMIRNATIEAAPAVFTALATTIVSFLPIFFMENAEGKLFSPLAFTKTFALTASFVLGFVALPTLTYFIFSLRAEKGRIKGVLNGIFVVAGLLLAVDYGFWPALALTVIGALKLVGHKHPRSLGHYS